MINVLTIIIVLAGFTANAQSNKEYFDLVKRATKIEAKELVYSKLNLTDVETAAFDPVFNHFLEEEGKIMLAKVALFEAYASNSASYSNDQMNELNKNVLKYDLKRSKVNQKYYKKFVKAIGVQKATAFFFVKKYLDNKVEAAKLDFFAN